MASKVHFGLKNVYYSVITVSGGTVTYATPVALPGGVSVSLSPEGSENVFYADDIRYYVTQGAQGYSGNMVVAMVTDDFAKDVLGLVESTEHFLVEKSSANPKQFALLFEVQGDDEARRYCFYNVSVGKADLSATTLEDTTEVQTATLDITCSGAVDTGYIKAYTTSSTASADYSSWFTTVPAPTGL